MRKRAFTAGLAIAAMLVTTSCSKSTADQHAKSPANRGASSGPIQLGYMVADWTGLFKVTGEKKRNAQAENRAQKAEMAALVKWANDTGGVGGRKIEATGFTVDQMASVDQLAAECAKITQDSKIEVLLDTSIFTNQDAWSCVAKARVAYLGVVSSTDSTFLKSVQPYIASTWPTVDAQMRALAAGMDRVGFLKGAKFGIALQRDAIIKRNYDQVLAPALRALGVTPTVKEFTEGDQASMNNLILSFKSSGVDHVFLNGTGLDFLNLTGQAQAQSYHPKYAFTDFQAMAALAALYGTPAQLDGSIAVSTLNGAVTGVADDDSRTGSDISSAWQPNQISDTFKQCDAIWTKAFGRDYNNPGQAGASNHQQVECNNFMLWLRSARAIGAGWTADQFGTGLSKVGTSYIGTESHATDFSAGSVGGPSDFRVGRYTVSCKCYVKVTDYLPLPQT